MHNTDRNDIYKEGQAAERIAYETVNSGDLARAQTLFGLASEFYRTANAPAQSKLMTYEARCADQRIRTANRTSAVRFYTP